MEPGAFFWPLIITLLLLALTSPGESSAEDNILKFVEGVPNLAKDTISGITKQDTSYVLEGAAEFISNLNPKLKFLATATSVAFTLLGMGKPNVNAQILKKLEENGLKLDLVLSNVAQVQDAIRKLRTELNHKFSLVAIELKSMDVKIDESFQTIRFEFVEQKLRSEFSKVTNLQEDFTDFIEFGNDITKDRFNTSCRRLAIQEVINWIHTEISSGNENQNTLRKMLIGNFDHVEFLQRTQIIDGVLKQALQLNQQCFGALYNGHRDFQTTLDYLVGRLVKKTKKILDSFEEIEVIVKTQFLPQAKKDVEEILRGNPSNPAPGRYPQENQYLGNSIMAKLHKKYSWTNFLVVTSTIQNFVVERRDRPQPYKVDIQDPQTAFVVEDGLNRGALVSTLTKSSQSDRNNFLNKFNNCFKYDHRSEKFAPLRSVCEHFVVVAKACLRPYKVFACLPFGTDPDIRLEHEGSRDSYGIITRKIGTAVHNNWGDYTRNPINRRITYNSFQAYVYRESVVNQLNHQNLFTLIVIP